MVEKLTTVFIINVVIKLNGYVMGVQVADPNAYRLQQLNENNQSQSQTKTTKLSTRDKY